MLNYAETTDVRTIVAVTPLPQSPHQEQMPDAPMSMLSALLAHPEFMRGFREGQVRFSEEYEPAPLTEEEMIDEVEMNLSRRVTERCHRLTRLLGDEPSSYPYNLGFVVALIDQGLSYS